jgi:replicative DNA helicase
MELNLPYDSETEDCILGTVIKNPTVYDSVSKYIINKDVFYQDKARKLWYKITELKRANQLIDMLSVCSALNAHDTKIGLTSYYVTKCTSSETAPGAAEFYANQIYEKYLLRRVIVYCEKIKRKAKDNYTDVYDSIGKAHSIFGELLDIRPSQVQDIEDVISETLSSIQDKKSKLITAGYPAIDRFSGGLTRGEITIVGGRPGHGKTTVMINMLSKVIEKGYKAVFFSRELPNSELMKKIICLESEQLSYSMVRKNVFGEQDLKIVNETIARIRNKYSSDKFLMFDNLKDFASSSAEVKRFKPDIIFDDYIQLISCKGSQGERRLQIEKLVNDYKWLAKEHDCAVVLASQLNRFIERGGTRGKALMPQLSDLAESGAIEQVAENVFFSYYDYKVQGEAGKGKNIITLIASKVRYGDSGYSDLGYDGDKCKVYNSIEEMINDELPFKD